MKHIVLGLDPGSIRTGWGVVELVGQTVRYVAAGVIRVREKAPIAARYPQAALMLGHARGVALLAAAQANLSVSAYPPAVVKRSVVGAGRAEKQQVALLVRALLGLRELPAEDATDALAVALTHLQVLRSPIGAMR